MSRAALHARQMLLIHGRQVVGLCGLGSVQANASRLLQDKYTAAALCGVGQVCCSGTGLFCYGCQHSICDLPSTDETHCMVCLMKGIGFCIVIGETLCGVHVLTCAPTEWVVSSQRLSVCTGWVPVFRPLFSVACGEWLIVW